MTPIALRFGPLGPPGCPVRRSGMRWLVPDGHVCRAGEVAAYCSIAVTTAAGAFADERLDLHVALAPRRAGRVRHAPAPWEGGYLDRAPVAPWAADGVWGHLDPHEGRPHGDRAPGDRSPGDRPHGDGPHGDGSGGGAAEPRLMFLAGRRFVDFAEQRAGLLTGWHDRARAWWGDGAPVTLLGSGTCEQRAMLGGADGAFAELFEACGGPAHVVLAQDEPQVPCARTLLEQLDRSPADIRAIRDDLARTFPPEGDPPGAADWLFMGALLNALERSPLDERYDILTTRALLAAPPPQAVALSITAEMPQALRHRRLGYTLNCHPFRLQAAGAAVRRWLRASFAPVARTPSIVAEDYRALLARLAGRATLFVVNAVATHNFEAVPDYAVLDEATLAALGPMRARALNLMLHDLATTHGLAIIDADAIAAGLGVALHLRDGVHASGTLNAAMRAELLRAMAERGLAGFAAAPATA